MRRTTSLSSELALPILFIEAKCLDADPDAFFPEKGGDIRAAKRICDQCPIEEECLEWALAHPEDAKWGVWGGVGERQRKKINRRRRET